MKGIYLTGPNSFSLQDLNDPVPGKNEEYKGRPLNYNFLVVFKLKLLCFGNLLTALYRYTDCRLRDAQLFG
jgi:hypothetical protein